MIGDKNLMFLFFHFVQEEQCVFHQLQFVIILACRICIQIYDMIVSKYGGIIMEKQIKLTQQITPASIEQLLGTLEQLDLQELMAFEEKFFEIKQQRIASLTDEKVLQQQIAYRFPKRKKQRMRTLLSKSSAGVITIAEKLELDGLIEEFEQKSLEKAEAMYLLAQRKQKDEDERISEEICS